MVLVAVSWTAETGLNGSVFICDVESGLDLMSGQTTENIGSKDGFPLLTWYIVKTHFEYWKPSRIHISHHAADVNKDGQIS